MYCGKYLYIHSAVYRVNKRTLIIYFAFPLGSKYIWVFKYLLEGKSSLAAWQPDDIRRPSCLPLYVHIVVYNIVHATGE